MIAFRYTKTDGAQYMSHLDLLRHIDRSLRRAGIPVNQSEGFHPHPKIYMNNPLGLGIKSVAEYCAVDSPFEGDFETLFNANSPKGIKCLGYKIVQENPNYAFTIERCSYTAEGINPFDPSEILGRENLIVTDLRGREIDVRPRICSLEFNEGKVLFTLGCGQNNLRPDLFCNILEGISGGKAKNIIKVSSHGKFIF